MSPNLARGHWRLSVGLTGAALAWSVTIVLRTLLVPTDHGQTRSGVNGLTLLGAPALISIPTVGALLIPVVILLALGLRLAPEPGAAR